MSKPHCDAPAAAAGPDNVRVKRANIWHYCSPGSVGWMNDPEVTRFLSKRGKSTFFSCARYYLRSHRHHILLAVYFRGRHVGNCGLFDPAGGDAELRISLGEKRVWGKGIATEAARQMLQIASRAGLKSVFLNVAERNLAARRVYEKAGFQVASEAGPVIDGEPQVRMNFVIPASGLGSAP